MNKTISIVAGAFLSALSFVSCNHTPSMVTRQLALDSLFTSIFPEGEPGGAVLIMKGEDVIFDKGYGLATLPKGNHIDGNTFFNIASCSKTFTAAAVVDMASKGLVDLDANFNLYFPEYTDPIWEKIKVRHLLSHSSGIPDERGYLTKEQRIAGDEDLATEYIKGLDHLNFEPGTAYEYINPTFVLLGKLIERISGMEFTEYMEKEVFVPAGMDKTLYFDRNHQDQIPNMAHGYEYADVEDMPEERTASAPSQGKKDWYEYDFGEETFFATRPDGGIYTSTHEMSRWDISKIAALMTKETVVSGSPYSDYQNRPDTWYGFGLFIEPDCVYHTGDNGGFKALNAYYPEQNVHVMIFANRADWDRYKIKTEVEKILGLNATKAL
ncbi:MAG: beta-lactamase family protein [Bacteroidales bacterium]|nr:beta-lactamase family protein [Bacteroidales bacterium]